MFLANVLQPLIGVEQWTLELLHSIGLGWGLAIVGLTLLVRLCTLPLVVRQFRSQRELRKHMPEMKALQQRHKGDRERL
ncbi:MAG: YidC/Oxa1 family rane protein insertase, partial [Thermoleophilaceae bacterium]|nr:YidC/Oxa1 family rane protein insertase [Thermoleophilaceae bacterium]